LIGIIKGPVGGFLASLGIAAILGGVALAAPAPPPAAVGSHPVTVVAAAPLGGEDPGAPAMTPIASGGVRTEDDPSGRGHAVGPGIDGSGPGHPGGPSVGTRSAGVSSPHGDAREDPPSSRAPAHDGHRGGGLGSDGNGGSTSGDDQRPTKGPATGPNGYQDGGGNDGNRGPGTGSGDKGSGDQRSGEASDDTGAGKPSDAGSGSTSH
jgi:hypothetical protein